MRQSLTVSRSATSHRTLRLGLALMAFVMLSAVASNAAVAKAKPRSCAKQVVGDWFDDGRVGKLYPLKCYTDAIRSLPPDILIYSNAEEEIGRALAFARQGKPDPGGKDPTPAGTTRGGTTPSDTTRTGTTAAGTTRTGTTPAGTTRTGTTRTGTTPAGPTPRGPTPGGTTPTQTTDTSGPSSVPIPLLVLGGLAVLLLAAGAAGYLRRRLGGHGDGDGTPPASA